MVTSVVLAPCRTLLSSPDALCAVERSGGYREAARCRSWRGLVSLTLKAVFPFSAAKHLPFPVATHLLGQLSRDEVTRRRSRHACATSDRPWVRRFLRRR